MNSKNLLSVIEQKILEELRSLTGQRVQRLAIGADGNIPAPDGMTLKPLINMALSIAVCTETASFGYSGKDIKVIAGRIEALNANAFTLDYRPSYNNSGNYVVQLYSI